MFNKINVSRAAPNINIKVRSGSESMHEQYTGSYSVKPSASTAQVLDTKGKIMTDDLTVEMIGFYETTNPSGGITIYIGD